MYFSKEGILTLIVEKYQDNQSLSTKDENSIIRFLKVIQRFSRKINQFLYEHKLFRIFKFKGRDY
jgi:hypothetical protein